MKPLKVRQMSMFKSMQVSCLGYLKVTIFKGFPKRSEENFRKLRFELTILE